MDTSETSALVEGTAVGSAKWYQTQHEHELCNETHVGKGEWAKTHRWTEWHCAECGESMAVPANPYEKWHR